MQDLLILTWEPFVGFMSDDVRRWLEEEPSEERLALALSMVEKKAAFVRDEVYEADDVWEEYAACEWEDLVEELVYRIEAMLIAENQSGANHDLTARGWRQRIVPFMQRNGYEDCSGWWIKKKAIAEHND